MCPVCYWQDAAPGQPSHNPLPLWRGQENFGLYGASHHRWLDRARSPLPHEVRPEGWRPIDPFAQMAAEREEVVELIAAAFRGVGRGNGITLHEADVIDGYGDKTIADGYRHAELADMLEALRRIPDPSPEGAGAVRATGTTDTTAGGPADALAARTTRRTKRTTGRTKTGAPTGKHRRPSAIREGLPSGTTPV